MAATPGNQWWKLRSKHGRDAIFSTPEILESACEEYFKATDERNDWDGQNWVGKDGVEVIVKKKVPYSIKGLCVFLGVPSHYFNDFKNTETFKSNKGFSEVYTRIEDIIQTQQIDGSMMGYYNASLTARLNGLVDKQEVDNKGHIVAYNAVVSKEEAKAISEALENDC